MTTDRSGAVDELDARLRDAMEALAVDAPGADPALALRLRRRHRTRRRLTVTLTAAAVAASVAAVPVGVSVWSPDAAPRPRPAVSPTPTALGDQSVPSRHLDCSGKAMTLTSAQQDGMEVEISGPTTAVPASRVLFGVRARSIDGKPRQVTDVTLVWTRDGRVVGQFVPTVVSFPASPRTVNIGAEWSILRDSGSGEPGSIRGEFVGTCGGDDNSTLNVGGPDELTSDRHPLAPGRYVVFALLASAGSDGRRIVAGAGLSVDVVPAAPDATAQLHADVDPRQWPATLVVTNTSGMTVARVAFVTVDDASPPPLALPPGTYDLTLAGRPQCRHTVTLDPGSWNSAGVGCPTSP